MNLTDAINGFLDGYFSTCQRSHKTRAAYKLDLAQLSSYLGENVLGEIHAEMLEGWANELRQREYAPVSIRRKLATTKIFFAYWVRKGMIDRSPLWKIRLDLGRQQVLPRNLDTVEAKKIIEQAWRAIKSGGQVARSPRAQHFLRLRDLAVIEVMFATGIRVGELVGLNISDWRPTENCFLVNGKGARQRLALLPDDRSLQAISMYLDCRAKISVTHQGLFLNAAGARISTQGVARLLNEIVGAARIDSRITPHMIRHTVATFLLRNGADIRVVQEVLGHSSIATTQRYTHVSKEQLFATLRLRHPSSNLAIQREFQIATLSPE